MNPEPDKNEPSPTKSSRQTKWAIITIVILLLAGIAVSVLIVKTGPKAAKKPPKNMTATVEVITVNPVSENIIVTGFGRLVPGLEINLQARVSGEVVRLHPDFIPGGLINEGETLVRLDDIDYRLKLQQAQNTLAQRQADLRIEEGNQTVARQEWELINQVTDVDRSSEDLALRKPQLAKAKADLKLAEAQLRKAEIDLERTVIKAPFNGVVRKQNVDPGSQVSAQTSIGVLTGTDIFRAEIALAVDKLEWIDLPDRVHKGAKAKIYYHDNFRQGRIVKLRAELEHDGLMAEILIEVNDPLGLKGQKDPLLLGSFVRAEIEGKRIENAYKIPRDALREDDCLLIAVDNTLYIQKVKPVWKDSDYVYIKEGLNPGDQVIVSNLSAPIAGMALRIFTPPAEKGNRVTAD